ncbi:PAS domain-containing sensor histidine kinase [Telluribacter sp. SYSU D00476]|uniref:sensor histidine kinase n=1 Tax=Telluribacter sp. SYSU D00476 TaxID=2811430 RepID=UPI001FF0FEE6|nr:PAS domain-containing sensor histidine kinase [Telluribacter sp. SYSU D00476]
MNNEDSGISPEEIHRQSELFKALIEHSSDVIVISDAKGIERYVSPSVRRVLGYEPEEFLMRSQYLLHHPDDRDRVRDTFFGFVNQCCEKPAPIVFSWRFLHKNGTWRWVEATASNQLDNPLVNGIILNIRDIHDHKEMENRLAQSAQRFQTIMGSIKDAIQIFDAEGKILFTNRESHLLEYSMQSFNEPKEPLWWIHPDDRPSMLDTFAKLVMGEMQEVTVEYQVQDANGYYRHLETHASNQLNNEAIGGILANVRDITQRKKLEESLRLAKEKAEEDAREIEKNSLEIKIKNRELKKLNEEKNELLQIVSHDLKNPLYNIQHQANLILTHTGDCTTQAQNILQCTDKMLNLIRNFLSIHAIESGKVLLNWQPVDLRKKIDKVLGVYKDTLSAKNIQVSAQTTGVYPQAWADPDAVYQILDNLISNAIKYSPVSGTIHISLETSSEYLVIRVQDEGAGIPLDELDKLFQKFTRLSTRPTAGESSNGLGLAIAKKLTQQLNGDIWYENHPDRGATFAFELPIHLTVQS